jgi:hypothetical protein
MTLLDPLWLLLFLPVAVMIGFWPAPNRILNLLRMSGLILVIFALAELSLKYSSRAGTIVVVADRSLSMPTGSDAQLKDTIDRVIPGMRGDDKIAVVSFGDNLSVDQAPQTAKFGGFTGEIDGDASNLADAIDQALGLIPPESPGRILVLSDGLFTGRDPLPAASKALSRNVAIDFRSLQRPSSSDLAVAKIDAPATVQPGEAFLITAWVQSPSAQKVSYELRRGETVVSRGEQELTIGLNRLTFRDVAKESGNQAYNLVVNGKVEDPALANNQAKLLVGVQGPKSILHVTQTGQSALGNLIRKGGLSVQSVKADQVNWTLEYLAKFSSVILENVPGEKLRNTGMDTVKSWVTQTGAGLMITGGRQSYGPGGYYQSPLEPIMPVSMELRQEHRKLSLAIVVVLDRSGSMALPVAGGKVKMDLADLGTASVLDLLNSSDEMGVIAVDSAPHVVHEISTLENKAPIRSKIMAIESMGGGIFIDEAMRAAGAMIAKAKSGTKHVILFSDAQDSEQPGDYAKIVEQMKKSGITVSVIGLGSPKDVDADLLRDIAKRGDGRIFFTDKAEELPRLFAQDTFVVARNTFIDEPTAVQATAALSTLTGKNFSLGAPVGGYNLCYIRPQATMGGITLDEYKAPLVAGWQAGAGRVLCFTGEADGKNAGAFAKWKDVGDFYTSLARWTNGAAAITANDVMVTQEVKNGINVISLHLDPNRTSDPFTGLPDVSSLYAVPGQSPRNEKKSVAWVGPDTLQIELPLRGIETSLSTVNIPGQNPIALAPVCLPYSPEFRPTDNRRGQVALERLASTTGGEERLELPSIWNQLPRKPRLVPLAPWLILISVCLLVLEVFERRTALLSNRSAKVLGNLSEWFNLGQRWIQSSPQKFSSPQARNLPESSKRTVLKPAPATTIKQSERALSVVESKPIPSASTVDSPAQSPQDMLEAMRQAKHKLRGRS